MVKFYNAADQKLYEQYKFLPQEQYRLGLNLPTSDPTNDPVVDEGIVNTNAFANAGGGDDFSVYNPDPNTISNENYRPNYDYRRFSEPDQSMIEMGRNQDYFYKPPPSKLQGLMSMIPGAGIARFLGNQIGGMLPTNRRAIMENELGGQGVMVNDIGQIVQGQGDYNTAENVMAGYNANKVSQKTIDDRKATINETIVRKSAADPNYDPSYLNKRLAALDEFGNTLDSTNTLTDKIFDFEEEEKKKKKKDNIISRFFKKKKAADAKTTTGGTTGTTGTTTGGTTGTTTGGGSGGTVPTTSPNYTPVGPNQPDPYSYTAPTYSGMDSIGSGGNGGNDGNSNTGGGASYSNTATTGAKDGYSYGLKKGGRAGYFFGGRVNYKTGGRINFRGGGADMGATDRAQERADRGYGSTAPADDRSSRQQTDNNNRVTGRGGNGNPPVTVVNNNPVDVSTITKSIGNYEMPYGVEALMANKGKLQAILNANNILDKNLGAEFTYDQGPYQVGFNADMEGNKNLGVSYNKGNLSAYANTDFNKPSLGFKYSKTFANGGRAGYAEGGPIYSRLGTLSSGVQSAEQQLQGINASLQKAESDLGSDSPGGGSSLAGGPSFTSNFEDANNQGPGSSLLFGGSMDQASPITAPTVPQEPGQPGGMFKDSDFSNGAIPPMNSIGGGQIAGDNFLNNTTAPFSSIGGGRIPGGNKGPESFGAVANPISSIGGVDPYKNTMISGLSQDGQRFDSAQNAFDALVEQTRKYREKSPYTRDVIGSERYRGEEGFKNFTNYFNEINDPSYSAPQLQSLGGGLGSFAPGVDPMGSRKENAAGPLQSLGRGIGSIL